MGHSLLKSLLGKRSEITAWLHQWTADLNTNLFIEDNEQQLLFGSRSDYFEERAPIYLNQSTEGFVLGTPPHATGMATLLSALLAKEMEKKKLGAEVLTVYQELNVIYNFSEQLTETIDPEVVASLALQQAMHSIPSASGIMVLWNENDRQLDIAATKGDPHFDNTNIVLHGNVLLRIGISGQSAILSDVQLLQQHGIVSNEIASVIYAGMKVKQRMVGAIILAATQPDYYTAAHLKLLVTLAVQSATAIESAMLYDRNIKEVQEREEAILRILEFTKKFVPNEFIRSLGKNAITDVQLGDLVEKNVTVLFTDIRDFTTLSEKMTPTENFRFVSSFNERLGPIVRKNNGFINQYLGDSIMAIFPEEPADALRAAVAMQQAIHGLNDERKTKGLVGIQAGIGMHTGPLIMGITGDAQRLDAATISDTVNTAARIEGLTKYYQSAVLLSSNTLQHIAHQQHYVFRRLGNVILKGKHQQLEIVACLNGEHPTHFERLMQTVPLFHEGVDCYQQQQFHQAVSLFGKVLAIDPYDETALLLLQQSKQYLHRGVPPNWTGAVEMHQK